MASDKKINPRQLWMWVGVVVLILLLVAWLTIAFLAGDTDVAASIRLAQFVDTFRP